MLEGKVMLASGPGWVQQLAEVAGVGRLTCEHELTIVGNIARYTATDAIVESQEVELPTHVRGACHGRCPSGRADYWSTYARSGPRRRRLLWLAHVAVSFRSGS